MFRLRPLTLVCRPKIAGLSLSQKCLKTVKISIFDHFSARLRSIYYLAPFKMSGILVFVPQYGRAVLINDLRNRTPMDYTRLFMNILLTIVFYYFFGRVNIATFSQASVSFTTKEETMTKVPSPGIKGSK